MGTGLDNSGDIIASPVRDIVGSIPPGTDLPFGDGYSVPQVVDGMDDGRLLVNLFRAQAQRGYVYWPHPTGAGDHSPEFQPAFVGPGPRWSSWSSVWDMNAKGDFIGFAGSATGDGTLLLFQSASVYGYQDLAQSIPAGSGWTLLNIYSINDRDQILGVGVNPQGRETAFLLTPEGEPVHVPEPGAWAVFGLAAAAFAYRRRHAG